MTIVSIEELYTYQIWNIGFSMSIFIAPTEIPIYNADLVCAILLLTMLVLKVVTTQQSMPGLARLNRSITMSLYPISLIFCAFLIQWVML